MTTILLVDDRMPNRQSLVSLLEYHQHRVLVADSGNQALDIFRAEKPDLLLTDILMPNQGGYQLVLRLHMEQHLVMPRVVFRTAAHAEREARALAQVVGISHVVPELAEPKVLLAAINAALSEPAAPSVESQVIDFDAIGSHLWPMVNALYRRVADLEMLNVRLDQSISEYAARLEVARAALAQEVAKRIWAERELTEANLDLHTQAVRDPLTGLFNRRYLEESLEREESRAKRSGRPVGVMMIDIDHFKRCNDTFGHAAGDEVLRSVSRYIQSLARAEDIFCRYGGEEFLLLMTNTSPDIMWERAEGLRQGVQKLRIEHDGRVIGPITLSAGIALFPDHGARGDEVLHVADTALYRAKESGRNCVVVGDKVEIRLPL